MLRFYNALLPAVLLLLRLLAPLHPRIRETLRARESLLDRWRAAPLAVKRGKRIWFHVSSVGELEQVRPVMEALVKKSECEIVVSYFSPSVPRLVKDWNFVKFADYLPFDFREQMHELVRVVAPDLLVLNRYDLWPNHMLAARAQGVPIALVNASTPPQGLFGRMSLYVRRHLFRWIDAWTFVDPEAASAWEPYITGRVKGLMAGDPRVDRSLARMENSAASGVITQVLSRWQKHKFCLVVGSSWPKDEDLVLRAWGGLSGPRSLIVVPHEPWAEGMERIERFVKSETKLSVVRLSELEKHDRARHEDVLIVDRRGLLAEIYALGTLAYVGGGFDRHIHSIIEPAAHHLPVAFGSRFHRSPEARTLLSAGAAYALQDSSAVSDLASWLKAMSTESPGRQRAVEAIHIFLQMHRGAGERVADFLLSVRR